MYRVLTKIILLLFISAAAFHVKAQRTDAEILLSQNEAPNEEAHDHDLHKPSVAAQIIKAPFNGALLFYQKLISPVLGANCGYHVSCSRFSQRALKKKGLFRGLFLTADRLTRCTPQATRDIPYELHNSKGKIKDEKFYLD